MSEEETKGEAGETEVALTEEDRLYDDTVQRYKEAGVHLDKAMKKLRDWDNENGDENDRYRQLKQDVMDANELLNDAERRWKDARAAAAERANNQRNAVPTKRQ